MLIHRQDFRSMARLAVSVILTLCLSGCWEGDGALLDGDRSYSAASFYGTGRKVFRSGDRLLIVDISATAGRFRFDGDASWLPISSIRKIKDEPAGHYVAALPDSTTKSRAYFIPFIYRKDGITVLGKGLARVESRTDLATAAQAAYQQQKIDVWRLLPPEEAETALRQEEAAKAANKSKPAPKVVPEVSSFRSDGYLYPDLFEAIYRGNTRGFSVPPVALYLQNFALMFRNAADDRSCNSVITGPALSAVTMKASADSLAKMFGPLFGAHQRKSSGRDDAFADGFGAGAQGVGSLMQAQVRAESDAKLFHARHRCITPTAVRFFANLNRFLVEN